MWAIAPKPRKKIKKPIDKSNILCYNKFIK